MVLMRRVAWSGLLILALWPLRALSQTPVRGADPFHEARQKLMAIAPSKLVWQNPKGLNLCHSARFPWPPDYFSRLDLLSTLLGTPFHKKNPCQLRVVALTEKENENFPLVLDVFSQCPANSSSCTLSGWILEPEKIPPEDRRALETSYEYLVDAGLMGAARHTPP